MEIAPNFHLWERLRLACQYLVDGRSLIVGYKRTCEIGLRIQVNQ